MNFLCISWNLGLKIDLKTKSAHWYNIISIAMLKTELTTESSLNVNCSWKNS
jgi:hypothetical protein